MSLKPICVACQRFYRPHKNGRRFVEAMPIGEVRSPPGTSHPELWKPYKVWQGDEWQCQGCGHLLIVGVAMEPLSVQHMENFDRWVASAPYLQVNDC